MTSSSSSFPKSRMWWTAAIVLATVCVSQALTAGAHKEVVNLDATNFDSELNDPNNPLWLLKFYAPWCGHCKHMAPILDRVAGKVAGKMAIGKIDCTIHKKLCDRYKISGYPTLKYSLDGVSTITDYPGARSETELIKFAFKMSAPAVTLVNSYETALEKVHGKVDGEDVGESDAQSHGVVFVAYDPQVQTIGLYKNRPVPPVEEFLRTTNATIAFEKVARKEQANANFAILQPGSDCCKSFLNADTSNSPGVVAGEEVHPNAFVARLEHNVPPRLWQPPANIADYVTSLHAFVTDNYFPVVNAVGPDNFHKLGRHGRALVLGVVQGSNSAQVEAMKQQLSDFGVNGPAELVSSYYLGWIDGYLWQKFLEQFEVHTADLPLVFVLDVPKKRYWQDAAFQKEHGIQAFLEAIRDGKIASKVSSGTGKASEKGFWGVVHFLESTFLENLPWSVVILISFCAAFAILVVPAPEELRPPYKQQPKRPKPPQEGQEGAATTGEAAATSDAPPETKKEK